MASQSKYLTFSTFTNDTEQQFSHFLNSSMCSASGFEPAMNTSPAVEKKNQPKTYRDHYGSSSLEHEPFYAMSSHHEMGRDTFSDLGGRETLSAEHILKNEYPLEVYPKTLNRSSEDFHPIPSTEFESRESLRSFSPPWEEFQHSSSKNSLQFSLPITKSLDDFKYASYPTNVSLFVLDKLCDVKKDNSLMNRWNLDSESLNSNLLFREFNTFSSLLPSSASHFSTLCLESLTLHDKEFRKHLSSRPVSSTPSTKTTDEQNVQPSGMASDLSETNTLDQTVHCNVFPASRAIQSEHSIGSSAHHDLLHTKQFIMTKKSQDPPKKLHKSYEKKLAMNHWVPLSETLEYPEHIQNGHVIFHVADIRRGSTTCLDPFSQCMNPNKSTSHSAVTATAPTSTHGVPVSSTTQHPKNATPNGTPNVGNGIIHPINCKPCAFFWTKGCVNGMACQFCHEEHLPKKKKSIEDQKNLLIIARPDGRIEYLRCNVKEALLRC